MPASTKLTPMLRHFLEVKAQHEDAILLYRMGDFFEIFFDDARVAAPILEVQLTARHKGSENEVPMCGVPHHAIEGYIGKLLAAGLRVAVCDQVENPAEAKGLVRREVTRVVTPGTVTEPSLLEGKEQNLLAGVVWDGDRGAAAFLDVSTGSFFVRRWEEAEEGRDDLELLRPREVLFEEGNPPPEVAVWIERRAPCRTRLEGDRFLDRGRAAELLERQFGTSGLRGFGLADDEPAVRAAAATLAYARHTQQSDLSHIRGLTVREARDHLILDATTLANLEVFRSLRDGGRKGTLIGILDRTVTAPGGRTLRDWLLRPLRDPDRVNERLRSVAEVLSDNPRRERLRKVLGRLGDPERLLSRAVLGTLTPREAAALRDTLAAVPSVLVELQGAGARILRDVAATDPLADLHGELDRLLEEEPAAGVKEGGVIAEGVDPELDHARSLARGSKRHILALETREREETGISSLKVRYNRVFGYYIEVTKANQDRVPEHYIRKQTLVNAERYITPEIKELEEEILNAEQQQVALEERYFEELKLTVVEAGERLLALAAAIGRLDSLASFAEVAARRRYVQPQVVEAGAGLTIRDGRHPVVEAASREPFVPNDAELDSAEAQIVILTGPNMGGKSTYLRQVALIALMAQAGSFVPAEQVRLGVLDRIFTRVGASDDLARGESTFMVEMIETANILRNAGADSLVILDEVGRGTATFDGLSLAWAIVEFLHEHRRPMTLFATHYHELTELAAMLPRVVNRTLAVKEWNDRIVFLRRVVAGTADKSYGLQVARLAGLPASVIERAGEILSNLEAEEFDPAGRPLLARGNAPMAEGGADQLGLFVAPEHAVVELLREAQIEGLTPLAALNLLADLKKRLE